MKGALRPDRFAVGLFLVGLVMFFVPLMRMPGVIAMLCAVAYWLTMVFVNAAQRRRS